MPQVVGTTFEMLLDLDLDTIVGALVLAVLVATLTAGAYLWLRRGKSDVTAMLVSLIVIANLACLVTGAGFIRSKSQSPHPLCPREPAGDVRGIAPPPGPGRHDVEADKLFPPRPRGWVPEWRAYARPPRPVSGRITGPRFGAGFMGRAVAACSWSVAPPYPRRRRPATPADEVRGPSGTRSLTATPDPDPIGTRPVPSRSAAVDGGTVRPTGLRQSLLPAQLTTSPPMQIAGTLCRCARRRGARWLPPSPCRGGRSGGRSGPGRSARGKAPPRPVR